MRTTLLALAFVIPVGIAAVSAKEARTSIGVLTCTSAGSAEADRATELGAHKMTCGFKPTASGVEERYSGIVRLSGSAAKTPKGKRVWVWAVMGPAKHKVPSGALAQKFVPAAPAVAGALPTLVGESNNTILLQAETANDAVDAAAQIELKLLTTPV